MFSVLLFCLKLHHVSSAEFCNNEIFEPNCANNELLFIKSAIYGRKEFGNCLKKEGKVSSKYMDDAGFVGCYIDVRHIIGPQCAGKQRCQVTVARIKADSKCLSFLKNHLDVDYFCLKGTSFYDCKMQTFIFDFYKIILYKFLFLVLFNRSVFNHK